MTLPEQQADLLEQYWDALAQDLTPTPSPELDPELAALASRLARTLRPPEPQPEFSGRLRQQLLPRVHAGTAVPAVAVECRRARRHLRPLGMLAVAAALITVVAGLWTRLPRLHTTSLRPTPALGSTAAPLLGTPSAPAPGWLAGERPVASDQGATVAFLRAIVHEPRFVVVFLATAGPGEATAVPADLQVLDQAGHALACTLTWLESTRGAGLGAVSVRGVDPAVEVLHVRVTRMRLDGTGRTLDGAWELQAIRRFEPGVAYPDRLEGVAGVLCFRSAEVTVEAYGYGACADAAAGRQAGEFSSATPAAVEGAASSTPTPAPIPTEAPAATAVPSATATPAFTWEFTDWERGLFGATLRVGAPELRLIYVFIDGNTGDVRRTSQEEFLAAAAQAQ